MSLCGTDPALFRQHNSEGVYASQLEFAECLGLLANRQWGAASIAVLLGHRFEFAFNERLKPGVAT